MRNGFRIGRLFGIDVDIDWSWLLIFFLITWNLATVFGSLHATWGPALIWSTAIIAGVLFFASVLAHELAHSIVARAQGVPVRNITLFLFGGVSNIEHDPPSPLAEFLIAIVGPITSLALGVLFIALAGGGITASQALVADPMTALAHLGPVATLLLWLGPINLILGVFNMVPGFPLDGGRVLRSILWAALHNVRRATRWASAVGQAIAGLMIFGGIALIFGAQLPFFGTGFINGVWLAFIGWFLSNAASSSYQQVVVRDLLGDVPVARLMRTDPPAASSRISVSTLIQDHIMGTDDQAFPVVDDGQLVGFVTLEDVRRVPREARDMTSVRQIMTPADKLEVVKADEDASDALDKFNRRDVRQLPVLQDGRMVGLLRRSDIVRWLQLQQGAHSRA
jgi:Zn-dependent protease/predicted transcriptional regulator